MAIPTDPRVLLWRLLAGPSPQQRSGSATSQRGQHAAGTRRIRRASATQPWMLRRSPSGSILVQALVAALIAVIAGLVLASRMQASRLSSFSRGDTLAAREAAEYGLNELQAQLNTDRYAYLWVTKWDNWNRDGVSSPNAVTTADLSACFVPALDETGTALTSIAVPPGVSSSKTITPTTSDTNSTTISYQLIGFSPPILPDNNPTTANQVDFCRQNTSSAAKFGNLDGGSAELTVRGTVSRPGSQAVTFSLKRRVLVGSSRLAYSFVILGDAYGSGATDTSPTSSITKLDTLNGRICYPDKLSTTCYATGTNPAPTKTLISCLDIGTCLINNVPDYKTQASKKCASVDPGQKLRAGFTCNNYQQAGPLPAIPTPTLDWNSYARNFACSITNSQCATTPPAGSPEVRNSRVNFPFRNSNNPPSTLPDSTDLVDGCYYNNSNGTSGFAPNINTKSIDCLVNNLRITNAAGSKPSLVINTNLIPVNLFLHGSSANPIVLEDGGIANSSGSSWERLRLYGKPASETTSPLKCNQSAGITISGSGSNSEWDLNNLFLWLPAATLTYQTLPKGSSSTPDTSSAVIWACQIVGPDASTISASNQYSIITPTAQDVRVRLKDLFNLSFASSTSASYRGYGSLDSTL